MVNLHKMGLKWQTSSLWCLQMVCDIEELIIRTKRAAARHETNVSQFGGDWLLHLFGEQQWLNCWTVILILVYVYTSALWADTQCESACLCVREGAIERCDSVLTIDSAAEDYNNNNRVSRTHSVGLSLDMQQLTQYKICECQWL